MWRGSSAGLEIRYLCDCCEEAVCEICKDIISTQYSTYYTINGNPYVVILLQVPLVLRGVDGLRELLVWSRRNTWLQSWVQQTIPLRVPFKVGFLFLEFTTDTMKAQHARVLESTSGPTASCNLRVWTGLKQVCKHMHIQPHLSQPRLFLPYAWASHAAATRRPAVAAARSAAAAAASRPTAATIPTTAAARVPTTSAATVATAHRAATHATHHHRVHHASHHHHRVHTTSARQSAARWSLHGNHF